MKYPIAAGLLARFSFLNGVGEARTLNPGVFVRKSQTLSEGSAGHEVGAERIKYSSSSATLDSKEVSGGCHVSFSLIRNDIDTVNQTTADNTNLNSKSVNSRRIPLCYVPQHARISKNSNLSLGVTPPARRIGNDLKSYCADLSIYSVLAPIENKNNTIYLSAKIINLGLDTFDQLSPGMRHKSNGLLSIAANRNSIFWELIINVLGIPKKFIFGKELLIQAGRYLNISSFPLSSLIYSIDILRLFLAKAIYYKGDK